jgi:ABC-type multidrug transport system fused ATPase/permease subunit
MIDFLKLFCKYVPPYLWRIAINIILSLISSVFSVFSFAAIIPVLQILFGISNEVLEPVSFSEVHSYASFLEISKSNALYFLQQQIAENGTTVTLLLISLFVFIMSLLANTTSYFATFVRVPVRTGILRDIRNELYRKITLMSIGYFEKDNRGDVMIRLTNDAEEVDYSLGSLMDILIKNPTKIIVYLATLFSITASLTWYSMGLLLICIFVLVVVGYVLKKYALVGQIHRGKLLSKFDESLALLLNIKAYNSEARMISSFKEVSNSTRKAFNRTNRHYSLVFPLSDFTVTAVMALLLYYGGKLILAGEYSLSAEEFIYFLMVFSSIIPCISDIARAGYGIRKAQDSVDRINTVLNVPENELQVSLVDNTSNAELADGSYPALELRAVSYSYGKGLSKAVNGVSFSIEKGSKVAIIGHTGSGKSTLAKLLPRFLEYSEGDINLFGRNIRQIELGSLRDNIAYVSQDSMLFNDSVFYNIAFGNPNAGMADVIRVSQSLGLHEFIMSLPLGYDTQIGDRGACMSGGQKQCISLARALLKQAPILILDEATSALDFDTEQNVMKAIDQIDGLTKIIITHRLSSIKKCDNIIVMQNGNVIDTGSPYELMNSNGYFKNAIDI